MDLNIWKQHHDDNEYIDNVRNWMTDDDEEEEEEEKEEEVNEEDWWRVVVMVVRVVVVVNFPIKRIQMYLSPAKNFSYKKISSPAVLKLTNTLISHTSETYSLHDRMSTNSVSSCGRTTHVLFLFICLSQLSL